MDPILGQIILWPVPWIPVGWALCDGTLLSTQQYAALFSLLGKTYGGDGQTTFALPDLRNRVPLGSQHMAQIGGVSGAASQSVTATGSVNLTIGTNNLPAHTHPASFTPGAASSVSVAVPASSQTASATATPGPGTVPCQASLTQGGKPTAVPVYSTAASDTTLKPFNVAVPAGSGSVAVGSTGSGAPLAVTFSLPVTLSVMQPALTLNYIIATQGVYPERP
jgi:microcystin-dependent protein